MRRNQPTGDRKLSRAAGGPISDHALINSIHRHVLELVTAVYLLYILLGTLIPFDLSVTQGLRAEWTLLGLGNARSGFPDLMSNIGLYVPLGGLLCALLIRWSRRPLLSVVMAAALAGGLSLAVESIQLLSASRISSFVDFGANVLGAAGGAVTAYLCRGPARRFGKRLGDEIRDDRLTAGVRLCGLVLVVGALAPFTPTLDVQRLGAAWQAGTFVPFAQTTDLAAQVAAASAAGDRSAAAAAQRDRMLLWARWAGEFLSFAVFGWLLHTLLRGHYRFGAGSALILTAYLTVALATVMSAIQLGILSRGCHLTDVLFRVAGSTFGYVLCSLGFPSTSPEEPRLTAVGQRMVRPALAVVLLFIAFTGLAPFLVDVSPGDAAARVASNDFLPFYSYYLGRFDRVCADFWAKSLLFSLLGAALWLRRSSGECTSFRLGPVRIAATALLISVALETAQLVMRSRVPTLTDPIIAALAAWIGAVGMQYALDFGRHSVRRGVARRSRPPVGRAMSPTDALVATLIPDPPVAPDQAPSSEQPTEYT